MKNFTSIRKKAILISLLLSACSNSQEPLRIKDANSSADANASKPAVKPEQSIYGTLEPFASEAVYFLMTDRFVDGDPSNDQVNQGGQYPTYRNELVSKDGSQKAYVGYMGGDFKGILDHADYIKTMGFTSIWLTPIVDQPNIAFPGGEPIEFSGAFKDGGKTGYHGYWGVNFFKVDEHLPSTDLSFKQLTQTLRQKYQIKTVLDIVLNHGSPAFSMPDESTKNGLSNNYGKIYDEKGSLIADHANLKAEDLDANNPLQAFYNPKTEMVQLSDINENNPKVLDYFTRAYLHWIDQGADAFRIDTIKHMPHAFWKKFSDNIRAVHPDFFMFAESYSFDPKFIAEHTYPKNGGISVLDFPGREALLKVFEKDSTASYADIKSYLHLTDGIYQNPYELMTFYDNHDMTRMNADDNGFIDAHNWLFTSRGIPVIYYGSEIGFMRGKGEHQGNRNYFGEQNIEKAKNNSIHDALTRIAMARQQNISLQRGKQINLEFTQDTASFYRIYEHNGTNQTALVLLNKGDMQAKFEISKFLSSGKWQNITTNETIEISSDQSLITSVPKHNVSVFVLNEKNASQTLRDILSTTE